MGLPQSIWSSTPSPPPSPFLPPALFALQVLREFKSRCTAICAEYFDSGDASEAGRSLDELAYPDLQHHFLKRLVIIAMERGNREKELASLLLASLSQHTLPVDQVGEQWIVQRHWHCVPWTSDYRIEEEIT